MLMKNLTSIIIHVLFISIITTSGQDDQQKTFINEVNEERRAFAKRNNLAGIHELTWSEKLHTWAEMFDYKSIPEPSADKNYDYDWRFTLIPSYKNGMKDLRKAKYGNDQKPSKVFMRSHEHLVANQTQIACVKKENLPHDFKIVCFLGPEYKIDGWSVGPPGSNCLPGYKNNDGLCSKNSSDEQIKFIKGLNEYRRARAKNEGDEKGEFTVGDMLELVWNETLEENGKNLSYESIKNQYDYAMIESFERGVEELKHRHHNNVKDPYKTGKEGEQYIHLYSFYHEISCVPKNKLPENFKIICFLEPKQEFRGWNKSPAGTACPAGWENNDGLCSIDPNYQAPTTTLVPTTSEISTTPEDQNTSQNPSETSTPSDSMTSSDDTSGTSASSDPTSIPSPIEHANPIIVTPEPPQVVPKELADYVETDGDDYDDDFPTRRPLSNSDISFSFTFSLLFVFLVFMR